MVTSYRYFGEACYPHVQGLAGFSDALDREDGHSSLLHHVSSITPNDKASYIRMHEFS